MSDPRLGRKYVKDDRDLSTADLHRQLGWAAAVLPPSALWQDTVVLDQGSYGTCVGNGWAGWGDSLPVADTYTETDARAIYYEATCLDGACDSTYQNGSTVRSGAKAMQNRTKLGAYAFATTLDGIREWLANHGPVVMGTDWLADMFTPDAQGFVSITGAVEGGHCYLCVGFDTATDSFRFRNSWGTSWGLGGDFLMKSAGLAKLLSGVESPGEACTATELPLPVPPTPPSPTPPTPPTPPMPGFGCLAMVLAELVVVGLAVWVSAVLR